jgi:hypothetical protein
LDRLNAKTLRELLAARLLRIEEKAATARKPRKTAARKKTAKKKAR